MDGSIVHFIQCLLDFDPVGVIFFLKRFHVLLTDLLDVSESLIVLVMNILMVLFDALLALSPDKVELVLEGVPIVLQLILEYAMDKLDGIIHLEFGDVGSLSLEFVDLLGEVLNMRIVFI